MSTTTASRADHLIDGAEAGAMLHAKNIDGDDAVAMAYQITLLEQIVRGLSVKLDMARASVDNQAQEVRRLTAATETMGLTIYRQNNQIREQTERLNELTFRLCDDDFDAKADELQRRITAFHNRSTGAASALRGEL